MFRKINKIYSLSFFALFIFLTCAGEFCNAQAIDSLSKPLIVNADSSKSDSIDVNMSDELKSKVHYPAYDSIIYDVVYSINSKTVFDSSVHNYIIMKTIEKIEEYINIICPDNLVFIAFDGVAPLAKLDRKSTRLNSSHRT